MVTERGMALSERQHDDLVTFVSMLARWNSSIRLVSKRGMGEVWDRHIPEAYAVSEVGGHQGRWLDIGSGSGFPGLVCSILRRDAIALTLVESDRRKSEFLRAVKRRLTLPVVVVSDRVEAIERHDADIVMARAVAPLTDLLGYHVAQVATDGLGLYLKGASFPSEIRIAQSDWTFDYEVIDGPRAFGSRIVKVWNVVRQ